MSKVLVLGSKGMLGGQLLKVFGNEAQGWDREDCDVRQFKDLTLKIQAFGPDAIINCVAYNDVDGAESNVEAANILNGELPGQLALISRELDVPVVHFSTNYVFDGKKGEYKEDDVPSPLSVYAASKYKGEQLLQHRAEKFYLIRTAVLFGPPGESTSSKRSFVDLMLDLSEKTDTIKAVNDEVNSVTYVNDLAQAVRILPAQKFPYGIYHFANLGSASWYDLAKEIFSITGKKINLEAVPSSAFKRYAPRPKKAVLLNTKFIAFRPWQVALKEYLSADKLIS